MMTDPTLADLKADRPGEGSGIREQFEDQLMPRLEEQVVITNYTETYDSDGNLSKNPVGADTTTTAILRALDGYNILESDPAGSFDIGRMRMYVKYDTTVNLSDVVTRTKDSTVWEVISHDGDFVVGNVLIYQKYILQRRMT